MLIDSPDAWVAIRLVGEVEGIDKERLLHRLIELDQIATPGAIEKLAPIPFGSAVEIASSQPNLILENFDKFDIDQRQFVLLVANGLLDKVPDSLRPDLVAGFFDANEVESVYTSATENSLADVRRFTPEGAISYVLQHRSEFTEITDVQLFTLLEQKGQMHQLVSHLPEYSDHINMTELADFLAARGDFYDIVQNLDYFNDFNRDILFAGLIETKRYHDIFTHSDAFDTFNASELFDLLVADNQGALIEQHIGELLLAVGEVRIEEYLIAQVKNSDSLQVLNHIKTTLSKKELAGIAMPQLGEALLAQGSFGVLGGPFREKFLNINSRTIFNGLVEAGQFSAVVEYAAGLEQDNQSIFKVLLEHDQMDLISSNLSHFGAYLDDGIILQIASGCSFFSNFTNALTHLRPDIESWPLSLRTAIEIGEEFTNSELLNAVMSVLEDNLELTDDLKALGVTRKGLPGIDQLKARMNSFKQEMYRSGKIDTALVKNSPALLAMVMQLTRYSGSQFGSHSTEEFIRILEVGEQTEVLNTGFIQPETVAVAALDVEQQKQFVVSEDGVSQANSYIKMMQRAARIMQPGGSLDVQELGSLQSEIEQAIIARIDKTQTGLDKLKDKIAGRPELADKLASKVTDQEKIIEELSSINGETIMSFSMFFEHFKTLSEFSELYPQLGTMLAIAAIGQSGQRPPHEHTSIEELQNLDLDDVNQVVDFIGRVTNQETWGEMFASMGGTKQLDRVLSIDALLGNIKRASTVATSGILPIRLSQTKGVMMELSGHIGDACWASKYDSIAQQFPNFSSVIMVQNPDSPHARLAGSSMLIEAESEAGEPLLIIRGLNPIQNLITRLSAQDFFDQFTSYVGQLAEESGRKVAVAIDNHSGGFGTNRPDLQVYMDELKGRLARVALKQPEKAVFNGYDIADAVYLL
jgi:hypothetical protein